MNALDSVRSGHIISRRLGIGVLTAAGLLAAASTGMAQTQYDAQCRPLPMPGMIMQPQPPSQDCLAARAAAARAAEAERKRRQERAEAAARARAERLAAEQAKCETAHAEDVRATLEADPAALGRGTSILDMTEPHFTREACRNEIMTNRGIVDTVITFQEFNGKQYLRVKTHRRPGG
ncbi:MAG: hypothetical protein AB7O80_15445 [Acetobacteraceae bacterium]